MAWSDAARKAAAEARKRKMSGVGSRIPESKLLKLLRGTQFGSDQWERERGLRHKVELVHISELTANPNEKWSKSYRATQGRKHIQGLKRAILGGSGKVGSGKITALTVKRNNAGGLTVIDGQHRLNLLKRLRSRKIGVQIVG